jgi:hypothetical protein
VLRRALLPRVRRRVASVQLTHRRLSVRIAVHVRQPHLVVRHSTTLREPARSTRALPGRIGARALASSARTRPAERQTPAVHGILLPAIQRVPMITRRSAPAEVAEHAAAEPGRPASRPADAIAAPARTPPSALPAVELQRVTDHVLRSLDRRLSAWRDRRGTS